MTTSSIGRLLVAFALMWTAMPISAAGPAYVDITWMSIANTYYELGPLDIVTDGYFTRIPQSAFFGGGGGLAQNPAALQA